MVKIKDNQFFMENLKMKRKKGQKIFDLPDFLKLPPKISIIEGDGITSFKS